MPKSTDSVSPPPGKYDWSDDDIVVLPESQPNDPDADDDEDDEDEDEGDDDEEADDV